MSAIGSEFLGLTDQAGAGMIGEARRRQAEHERKRVGRDAEKHDRRNAINITATMLSSFRSAALQAALGNDCNRRVAVA